MQTCHYFVAGIRNLKRTSVSIRIIHQCIDVLRHFARAVIRIAMEFAKNPDTT